MKAVQRAGSSGILKSNSESDPLAKTINITTKRDVEFQLRINEGMTDLALRQRVAYFLLSLFALNTVSALAIIFLVGFGLMELSNSIIITLIGETVAYAAAMFFTITKYLFPNRG